MNIRDSDLGYWICASYQHLKCFSITAENIEEFEATRLAGQIAILLNALRGRNIVNLSELKRIGKANRIGKTIIQNNVIPILKRLKSNRIIILEQNGKIKGLEEHIDTSMQLYEIVARIWEMLDPSIIERGAIHVLKHTYDMPRFQEEEFGLLINDGFKEEDAVSTVGIATSFRIIQKFEAKKFDEAMLFNPYVWRTNYEKIAHALNYMNDNEKEIVSQCITQAKDRPAYPVEKLTNKRKLLITAHSIGLIDLVEVNTAVGDRKEFVFTPHLTTHPEVASLYADDLLNDVRAVLSCISYGEHFSRISKLGGQNRAKTINFLKKLLKNGVAGDATAIGVDYKLLEERGIITVEPTPSPPGTRFQMRLLRVEPLKIALRIIEESLNSQIASPFLIHTKTLDPASLFADPEATRVSNAPSLGQQPEHVKEAREHFLRKIRKEVF
jgi:hypothetical protein